MKSEKDVIMKSPLSQKERKAKRLVDYERDKSKNVCAPKKDVIEKSRHYLYCV